MKITLSLKMSNIRQIRSELKELCTGETKNNRALEICTEQKDRVIQIRKSSSSFSIENFLLDEAISLNSWPSSQTFNSIVGTLPEKSQNFGNVS